MGSLQFSGRACLVLDTTQYTVHTSGGRLLRYASRDELRFAPVTRKGAQLDYCASRLLRVACCEQPRKVVRREESRPKDSLSLVFKGGEKQTRREAHGVLLYVRQGILVVALFEHATRCDERVARRNVHVCGCIMSRVLLAD